jgi:hypothetical protein
VYASVVVINALYCWWGLAMEWFLMQNSTNVRFYLRHDTTNNISSIPIKSATNACRCCGGQAGKRNTT